jgi:MFS superfamily sulfate permease-like transporter
LAWLFPSLAGYRGDRLRGDLIAGLTVWAVLIPEALAYASIAGVSPVIGVEIVGAIESGLPAFGVPDVSAHDYATLVPGAIG